MLRSSKLAVLAFLGYVGSILLANYLSTHYGLVPAGFGLLVSAGTYAAGLSLALRDGVQDLGGKKLVIFGIICGIAISPIGSSGRIALASAVAFGVGELFDWCVYTPLRKRGWKRAVFCSNLLGAFIDTLLFLRISGFGVTERSAAGQMLVKAGYVTGGYILLGCLVGWLLSLRKTHAFA